MKFYQKIREVIEKADILSIEGMRIAAIVFGIFVFGIMLRGFMFSSEVKTSVLASTQPAAVHNAVAVLTEGNDNASLVLQGDANETIDAAVLTEHDAGSVATATETILELEESDADDTSISAVSENAAPITLFADAYIAARGTMPIAAVYEKNSHKRRAPASLTKLMTATVVFEQIPEDEIITITESAVVTEGVAGHVRVGEQFRAGDLMKMMLIVSSNDAAVAFEDHFTATGDDLVAHMNEKARELGMNDTHFTNPSGLDADEHYASAFDLMLLASYSLRHERIWEILSEKADTVYSVEEKTAHPLLSNNPILHKGVRNVTGSKTGYTEQASGCMITALADGNIVVVLGSQDRARDTEQLINAIHQ